MSRIGIRTMAWKRRTKYLCTLLSVCLLAWFFLMYFVDDHLYPTKVPIVDEFTRRQHNEFISSSNIPTVATARVAKMRPPSGPCSANITDASTGKTTLEVFDPSKINSIELFHCYPLASNISRIVEQTRQGVAVHDIPINTYIYTTYISNECSTNEPPFIVYLIKTRPESVDVRNAIRSTWGNETLVEGVRVKRVFLLGVDNVRPSEKKLMTEQREHGDLLQDNFADTYLHTRVKMTMGFRWATKHCANAQYLVFADDDVFINPWAMVKLLSSDRISSSQKLYLGAMHQGHAPFRDQNNVHYVSVEEYPFKSYPQVAPASTVIVDMAFANDFVIAWQYVRAVRFDDVYLGIVAHKLGVKPLHTDLIKIYGCKFSIRKLVSCVGEFNREQLLTTWRTNYKQLA